MPVVELKGVGRRFASVPPVDALVSVDLRVYEGEWLAIVGPSGSGKSTLLNVLGCLDQQTEGSYRFCGIDVSGLSDKQRASLRCRGIGFVFQSFHLLAHRPIIENVMLADVYRRAPKRGRRERAALALENVNLSHRAEFLPTRLSGGERQRAAIARALVASPHLLLCDEPTGNLDTATTYAILELFAALNAQGATIVTITHDHAVAARARRQVRIEDGALREY